MTEEEKGKEYAEGVYNRKINTSDYDEEGKINYRYSDIEQAYLAGLHEGQPKWHKVADGDLPKNEKDVLILYQDCDKRNLYTACYDTKAERWLYYNLDDLLLEPFEYNVIAWCEIPQFKE